MYQSLNDLILLNDKWTNNKFILEELILSNLLPSFENGTTGMAEYSKEWCEVNQKQLPHDFSIREIFLELQEGESCETICEGFGVIKVMRKDNECILLFLDGKMISYKELLRSTS